MNGVEKRVLIILKKKVYLNYVYEQELMTKKIKSNELKNEIDKLVKQWLVSDDNDCV